MRKVIGSGVCTTALGLGALSLYAETIAIPEAIPMQCADGVCVPRRLTNGYYPTKWRRWPIEPAAAARPGVREGISAPQLELPDPEKEIELPEGAMGAPPPAGPTGPESGPPRSTVPTGPPPGRTGPRGAAQPGLPPELRYEMPPTRPESTVPRFPSDDRPSRQGPPIAARSGERAAAALEVIGGASNLEQASANSQSDESAIPRAQPGNGNVEPLPPTSPGGRGSLQDKREPTEKPADQGSRTQWTPAREIGERSAHPSDVRLSNARPDLGSEVESSGEIHSSRLGARLSALRRGIIQLDAAHVSDEPAMDKKIDSAALPASVRPATAGLNTPASIASRGMAEAWPRARGASDLTISKPAAPGTLAVRTTADEKWDRAAAISNPLRSPSGVTKVAFESAEVAGAKSGVVRAGGAAADDSSHAKPTSLHNPLR